MSSNLAKSDAEDEYISSINSGLASSAPVEEGQVSHDPSRGAQEPVLTVDKDLVENGQPKLFGEITGIKTPTRQVLEAENLTVCPPKDVQEVNMKDQKADAVFPTLQPSNTEFVQTVENFDEVNSESQDPHLVLTTQKPILPEGQAQSPVLLLAPLTVPVKHHKKSVQQSQVPRFEATSINSSELSSTGVQQFPVPRFEATSFNSSELSSTGVQQSQVPKFEATSINSSELSSTGVQESPVPRFEATSFNSSELSSTGVQQSLVPKFEATSIKSSELSSTGVQQSLVPRFKAISINSSELSSTGVHQSPVPRFEATSINSSELSSTKSGSCFEILEVKPNHTNSRQSHSQARGYDNVDVQTNTTTKHPQQVADGNQKSWGYMDLFKRQLQYNQPSLFDKVESNGRVSLITNVEAGQFPPFELLHKEAGLLIFSTVRNLIAGEVYIKPQSEHYLNVLGRGGNGRVIEFPLRDRSYAVKVTRYRENELNIWSTLQHPNILPLLAVMIGEQHGNCYQFMPQMSGDLRSMMINRGDLLTLLKQQPQKREMFLANLKYTLAEIYKGLVYLDRQRVQHGDLKASNILVQKECRCVGILHCRCVDKDKYTLKISDFDCAKQTKFARKPDQLSLCETSMTDLQMEHVKGTCSYRAPEQFKLCPSQAEYKKTLIDGKVLYDMEGPWCDIWSMGVILLKMLGKEQAVHEACMLTSREGNSMHPSIEPTSASICLIELLKTCWDQPELNPLVKVASECLTIDFAKRPTAEEILSIP